MGWNQASDKSEEKRSVDRFRNQGKRRSPLLMRGLIAALIVVAGASIAAYFLLSSGDRPPKTPEKRGVKPIPESTPAITEKSFETNSPPKPKRKMYWEVDESETNGFTEVMQRKWEQVRRPRRKPVHVERKKQPYEIFSHKSENQIAMYLAMKPGTGLIGTPMFGKRFVEDFMKSCEEPIVIDKKDDAYTRELKQLMIDTKIDLRNRMNAGEDLEQIMMDTHKELQKMNAAKREMENLLRSQIGEVNSEQEADDLIAAANRMLEEKGISPIGKSPVIRANIRRMIRNSQKQGANK